MIVRWVRLSARRVAIRYLVGLVCDEKAAGVGQHWELGERGEALGRGDQRLEQLL